MSLSAGVRLGQYEILSQLGEGGMGEVYRARDTKLKRDVALKVLPEAFSNDPERMARFQREAEVLASLNHPNIAAIYGVEDRALIMELVEGDSPKGPLPFDEAWHVASQMVAALEYAHDKGIVHRDLKPANIKITPDGVVKLLDFGLAKAFTNQKEPSASVENSPTLTIGATEVGVILGTVAYMSPEQAKGKNVDKRADIWSFGVVLYELLTGGRPFQGEDVADTLAQVLTKQPNWERTPVKARRLLKACLQKEPQQRLRDIGDAKGLLDEAPQASTPPWAKLPWSVAALAVAALIAMSIVHFRETPASRGTLRYTIAAPERTTDLHSFAISPDGRLVAIAADVNGKRQIWLRALDGFQARPMPNTEDARYPFWSPDSRYIGFFAQGKLKKIAASGGPAQALCDAPNGRGGSWNRDDVIVFSPSAVSGVAIQRVSASGGVPVDVIRTKGNNMHPVFLPSGHHFLYLVYGLSVEQNGVYLVSLDGKENRRILADESSAVFSSGRLLFIRENSLMAQPFNATNGQIVGDVFQVAEGVSGSALTNYAPVSVSETGTLLYASGLSAGNNQMAWYDRGGKPLGTVGEPGLVFEPALSPDENSVLFLRRTGSGTDLWLRDLKRGSEQRLTNGPSNNVAPVWSRNGDGIVFSSNRGDGTYRLYQKTFRRATQDELLLETGKNILPSQWSRDGRFVIYFERDPTSKLDIWALPVGGGAKGKPLPFLRSGSNEIQGQLSPDGHWMAYTSDESGQREVYLRRFPGGEDLAKISIAGGEQPRWRGDGKELFFMGEDGRIMAVALTALAGANSSFEVGQTQPLFEAHLAQAPGETLFQYDVTADAKRFLLDTVAGSGSAMVLNVTVNWNSELTK